MECRVKLSKHDKGEIVDPTLFKSLVESLRYLTCTRPNILYAVGLVNRYMKTPIIAHTNIAKRIIFYIKDTIDFSLLYSLSNNYKLVAYSNNDSLEIEMIKIALLELCYSLEKQFLHEC